MSCSSSSGSGCSSFSVPAVASSAAYQINTYKYIAKGRATAKETNTCLLLIFLPFWLMLLMGIVAGLAIYINDVVSSFNSLQPVSTHQNSSQMTSPTKAFKLDTSSSN